MDSFVPQKYKSIRLSKHKSQKIFFNGGVKKEKLELITAL